MSIDRSRRRFIGSVSALAAPRRFALLPPPRRGRAPAARQAASGAGEPALLGGAPVRTRAVSELAGRRRPRGAGADRRSCAAASGAAAAATGAALRAGVRRAHRRQALPRHRQRHERAAHRRSSALGVGPGDEVIVPPYTFVATINAVLMLHALPVFVDTDLETFQIDARKVAAAITAADAGIMPVHLGGSAADLDTILAAAAATRHPRRRGRLPVAPGRVEGPEGRHLGRAGCFSFQASKNLNSGEGGAIAHQRRRAGRDVLRVPQQQPRPTHHRRRLLVSGVRAEPAADRVPGGAAARADDPPRGAIASRATPTPPTSRSCWARSPASRPAKMYAGCTRNAYHLYMFRYDARAFAGLSRAAFLKALARRRRAGLGRLLAARARSRSSRARSTAAATGRSTARREIAALAERNRCPQNERLCTEAVWLTQTMLLGPRQDMDQIAEAIRQDPAPRSRDRRGLVTPPSIGPGGNVHRCSGARRYSLLGAQRRDRIDFRRAKRRDV